ncbi:MAG: O-antigen ligase family protein [Anaerolineae bacterium]
MHLHNNRTQHQVGAGPRLWDSLLEASWLLAAILTPLAVNLWGSQPFEPFKAALLRSVVWVMVGLWLAGGLAVRRNLWRDISGHPLFWPALTVIAVQTLATLLATDRALSFWGSYERAQGWLTLVSYGLLFLLVASRLRTLSQARRLALTIVLTGVPLTALGLAQASGWAPLPLLTDARSPVYATLGRSNFLGAYLAILLPLTLAICLSSHARSWRLASACLLIGEIAVIALTQARGAWLATAVAVALFVLAWFWSQLGARGRRWQVLAASVVVLGLLGSLALSLWVSRSGGSTAARLTIWRAVVPLIGQQPLLGRGPEALGLVFPQAYPPELVYYQGRSVLIDRAHNLLLDWAVTTGTAGVLAQVTALALFFMTGWRAAQRTADRMRRALLAGCVAAVGGNIAGNLVSFDVTATATATALLMALAVGLARPREIGNDAGVTGPSAAEMAARRIRQVPGAATAALSLLVAAGLGAALWQANLRPVAADIAARSAEQRAIAGDWSGAIEAAERAVVLWPREPAYRRALSWAWLQWSSQAGVEAERGLRCAETALLAARDLRPGEVRTWAALGELYGLWGNRWEPRKLPLAHAAYAQATALAPSHAMLYTSWGMVELEGRHYPEAAARFRQAVDLDATDGYAFAHLGDAELAMGQIEEAEAAYRQAVHWQPELSPAHSGLAHCLWLQGQRLEAERALRRALELDPDNPAGLALRSEMGSLP